MVGFEEGFLFIAEQKGAVAAAKHSADYVQAVQNEIDKLIIDINSFEGVKKAREQLKGDVAEFWHADSFNVNAAARKSEHRAKALRSNEYASPDITTNFGTQYGSKYYENAKATAKAQSVSHMQRFKESQKGVAASTDEFLKRRGFDPNKTNVHHSMYEGQIRLAPSDQLEDARSYLSAKVAKEEINRPEQVARYQDTLDNLTDRITDNKGVESAPLSLRESERLADLGKLGKGSEETLGITAAASIHFSYMLKDAAMDGLQATILPVVLQAVIEMGKVAYYLKRNGELEEGWLKKAAVSVGKEGASAFLVGALTSMLVTSAQAGKLGGSMAMADPQTIATVVALTMTVLKSSYKVANGEMSRQELVEEFINKVSSIGTQIIHAGTSLIGLYMGSFIGSAMAAFAEDAVHTAVISFCQDSGFTMFGLVDQDYTLPKEILEQLGVETFEFETLEADHFEVDTFQPETFGYESFVPETLGIKMLRRGVIGVDRIGYVGV